MSYERMVGRVAVLLIAGSVSVGACGPSLATDAGSAGTTSAEGAGGAGSTSPPEILAQGTVDKIDLLLAIDNSSSMGDKQQVLAATIPALVTGLLNPACVESSTGMVGALPASPLDACDTVNPPGFNRSFTAIVDVHIGVVSSSLGGHGNSGVCTEEDSATHQDDAGHLITRTRSQGGTIGEDDGWNGGGSAGEGFLLWDPSAPGSTPQYPGNGITSFGTPSSGDGGLEDQLADLVLGAGQIGCGFESQLESWYRFLVDPHPYRSIVRVSAYNYEQRGIDTVLMTERADFLRSDSLLAIVMLTDQNDCSVKEYGAYPILTNDAPMVRPTAPCETDPLDPCCGSCLSPPSGGCGSFEECAGMPVLSPTDDPLNLRCFNTQQRFGVDFLYPVERYATALTAVRLPDPHDTTPGNGVQNDGIPSSTGVTVPNPLYSDLQTDSSKYPRATHQIRDPSRVVLAGIVGVPWQDIAVDPNDATLAMGFKDSAAMTMGSPSTWDLVIGKPDQFVRPLDPHMIESSSPRSGSDPANGATLAPPTAAPTADPINGHVWNTNDSDLQYACVFSLPTPKDCAVVDCDGDCPTSGPNTTDNPLCDPTSPTLQTRAKAYPGIRELQVVEAVGDQGIVGSICPVATSGDPSAASYGYNASVRGIIDRLKRSLARACFAKQLMPVPSTGAVRCHLIEAVKSPSCDPSCATVDGAPIRGRSPISSAEHGTIAAIEQSPEAAVAGWNCFCEIDQLSDTNSSGQRTDALHHCLTDTADSFTDDFGDQVAGWCYVDPSAESGANEQLVADCPAAEQRRIRFIGEGDPVGGSTTFITCSSE